MLEARAHKQLKQVLQRNNSPWSNHLTLSRLVARSLRRNDRTLIKLDPSSANFWWIGLLFPLCLESFKSVMVVSDAQRHRLLNIELPRLQAEGFSLGCWEGLDPPNGTQLWLLSPFELAVVAKKGLLKTRQLIIPEADQFVSRLRDAMTIKILQKDWDSLIRANPTSQASCLFLYEKLARNLFTNASRADDIVMLDYAQILELQKLFNCLNDLPYPWSLLVNIDLKLWGVWAELDHKCLQWTCALQPLEPLQHFSELFKQPLIFLSQSGANPFLENEIAASEIKIDVVAKLSEPSSQESIDLFLPLRQPFPNTRIFKDHLVNQSRRLILGRAGITVVLLDDSQLRRQLATELAAEFGMRVVHEMTTLEPNGVVLCTWNWWLCNYFHLPLPDQIIIALLPLSSLQTPITASRVAAFKKQGRDWFRDFLLPEALSLLPPAVSPLRLNKGRLAILDGRIRGRSWGEQVLRELQPWTPLNRLLPG